MLTSLNRPGGAVAQLGARLDGIEEVVGSNPIGSTTDVKLVLSASRSVEFQRLDQIQSRLPGVCADSLE